MIGLLRKVQKLEANHEIQQFEGFLIFTSPDRSVTLCCGQWDGGRQGWDVQLKWHQVFIY